MPRHHHVNLGVPVGGLAPERDFLVDLLGYRELTIPEPVLAVAPNATWFESDDGAQLHLSEDPDHKPPASAHVAVQFAAEELTAVGERLRAAGIGCRELPARPGFPPAILLKDPAGNRWELRGPEN